jgi:hypothetical protein
MKPFGVVLALCSLCVTVAAMTVLSLAQEKKPDAPRSDPPTDFSELFKTGDNHSRLISGHWYSTKDPTKSLESHPQEVKIRCTVIDLKCTETSTMVSTGKIEEIKHKEWNITTWDSHRLIAAYGDDPASPCQRHVLTMNFDSGATAVSASDIPTHREGCEAFTETESYGFVQVRDSAHVVSRDDLHKPKTP